ncbi:MAG: transposase [Armatimonadetes bacterium]|nr:transposase [Armatimonadota bacterium]
MVQERIQGWLQELLEAEVAEFLGRAKHVRREEGEERAGYRNGYGKARQVGLSCGSVTVRRPRVRGIEEKLESRGLPLLAQRTQAVAELLPQLYLQAAPTVQGILIPMPFVSRTATTRRQATSATQGPWLPSCNV